jgi:branched-chain amino acid transport system permease protein
VVPPSYLYTLTDAVILSLFAVGFNMLFGYGGQLSFGHAAYFGVGGYVTALTLSHMSAMPVLLALLVGTCAAALIGGVVGMICVRRSGAYFAMLTMAFGMLIFLVAWKARSITGGDDGFGNYVPDTVWLPLVGSFKGGDLHAMYHGVLAIVVPILVLVWALLTLTPYGNAVRSIRMNEQRASFLGFDVFAIKLVNYILASAIAGLAGGLYALSHNFISPQMAGVDMSTDVVMMAFIGGSGSFFGPLLGTAFFVLVGDWLSSMTERWQMVMGVVFILMVIFAPKGFMGLYSRAVAVRKRDDAIEAKTGAAEWT